MSDDEFSISGTALQLVEEVNTVSIEILRKKSNEK